MMKAFKPQIPAYAGDNVEDQAAAWSDALRDGDADPGLSRAFESWRAADPAHEHAFAEIDRAYRIARAAGGTHALESLEAEIMHRVTGRRWRRRQVMAGVTGLAASVLVALTVVLDLGWSDLRYLPERAFYALTGDGLHRTEVGERLAVALGDGSRMTLNTDSRAVVRYRDGQRGVTLTRGQALFEVARDKSRPFVVTAGDRKVTALGTKFDVRMTGERLQVTLIEGRVAVEETMESADEPQATGHKPQAASHKPQATILSPGEQLVALAAAAPVVRPADIQRAVSWRDGQVIFENDPLAEAVAEINRYSKRHVVLTDDRLGGMRLSGAFNTSNTRVFVDMLTVHFPVTIVESSNDRIVLGYNGG
jgi:transmembrane sensor